MVYGHLNVINTLIAGSWNGDKETSCSCPSNIRPVRVDIRIPRCRPRASCPTLGHSSQPQTAYHHCPRFRALASGRCRTSKSPTTLLLAQIQSSPCTSSTLQNPSPQMASSHPTRPPSHPPPPISLIRSTRHPQAFCPPLRPAPQPHTRRPHRRKQRPFRQERMLSKRRPAPLSVPQARPCRLASLPSEISKPTKRSCWARSEMTAMSSIISSRSSSPLLFRLLTYSYPKPNVQYPLCSFITCACNTRAKDCAITQMAAFVEAMWCIQPGASIWGSWRVSAGGRCRDTMKKTQSSSS